MGCSVHTHPIFYRISRILLKYSDFIFMLLRPKTTNSIFPSFITDQCKKKASRVLLCRAQLLFKLKDTHIRLKHEFLLPKNILPIPADRPNFLNFPFLFPEIFAVQHFFEDKIFQIKFWISQTCQKLMKNVLEQNTIKKLFTKKP